MTLPLDLVPSVTTIAQQWRDLTPYVKETPITTFDQRDGALLGSLGATLWLKLELMQYAGSFKTRACMAIVKALCSQSAQRDRVSGVVTASGGNHALALAYAANQFALKASVVMPKQASPLRIARCQALGADVILAETISEVFPMAQEIAQTLQYEFVHPFEGQATSLATATIGYEFLKAVPPLDAMVVPVGGGGLISGVAAYVKQALPSCQVIGVEPATANVLQQSIKVGRPIRMDDPRSCADSLCSPMSCPYSFSLIDRYVDDLVTVEESEIKSAIRVLQEEVKLAVEPAAACGVAALLGPLRGRALGSNIGIVVCGSNIDALKYHALLMDEEQAVG